MFCHLDEDQKAAVTAPEGPVLVLAGAGSGKTRVLTERIVHLIEHFGYAPEHICALTFTNKAARHMHERIINALRESGRAIHPHSLVISTFHSLAVRLIKRHAEALGYKSNLSIYDDDAQKRLIKNICREQGRDERSADPSALATYFSRIKESSYAKLDADTVKYFDIFEEYERRLRESNAIDFSGMLLQWYKLLRMPETAAPILRRWRYILVDEFQDTNAIQFAILKRLCAEHGNIFAVGDEDQSIYAFRGAVIDNIINFETSFPDTRVIQLRYNYRSTQNILKAAQHVINRNSVRKSKKELRASAPPGELVTIVKTPNDINEADVIVDEILRRSRLGAPLRDMAVFYRTHSLARLMEDRLRRQNIPYRVIGSIRFYDRAEIKDALAYLTLLVNPNDSVALRRVINTPPRGAGAVSLSRIDGCAAEKNKNRWEILCDHLSEIRLPATAHKKLTAFAALIREFQAPSKTTLSQMARDLLQRAGYIDYLGGNLTAEAESRVDNVRALISAIAEYESQQKDADLADFLEALHLDREVAGDGEEGVGDKDYVSLMTCHGAKGLEFPHVCVVGCDDGCFPLIRESDIMTTVADIEEERRLFYVAMTRAKQSLLLTHAQIRKINGRDTAQYPSRFLSEAASEYVTWRDLTEISVDAVPTTSARPSLGTPKSRPQNPQTSDMTYQYEDEVDLPDDVRGRWIKHPEFGRGQIISVEKSGDNTRYRIRFNRYGIKRIAASFASLEGID